MKTDHQMLMLARAKKEGVAVHPLLTLPCTCSCHSGIERLSVHPVGECAACKYATVLNPDPMALIAACDTQKWGIHFSHDKDGLLLWIHVPGKPWHKDYIVRGPDRPAALTDAVFQATLTLAPENWMVCPCCLNGEQHATFGCANLGWVIKETDGN